jgi:hypothetical protein
MAAQSGRDSIAHAAELVRDAMELLRPGERASDIAAHLDLAAARLEILGNKQPLDSETVV